MKKAGRENKPSPRFGGLVRDGLVRDGLGSNQSNNPLFKIGGSKNSSGNQNNKTPTQKLDLMNLLKKRT
jgi:hypothetical protein